MLPRISMVQQIFDSFESQDYKNNIFDVIFHVGGKELYAYGHILAAVSPVFKEQLLQNRSTPNKAIQINDFSYDEFKEFLSLVYYEYLEVLKSSCYEPYRPYDENTMIELAHLYKLDDFFKDRLGRWFHLDIRDIAEVFQIIEVAYKYSLKRLGKTIENFVKNTFDNLIEYGDFVNLEKSVVEAFVNYLIEDYDVSRNEKICKTIYKWGEYQAMVTVEMPEKEKNQLVLHYIKDILPNIKFEYMSHTFLTEFCVEKGLISIDEANQYQTMKTAVQIPVQMQVPIVHPQIHHQVIEQHQQIRPQYFQQNFLFQPPLVRPPFHHLHQNYAPYFQHGFYANPNLPGPSFAHN